jgi:hypothetical protein
VMVRPSRRRRLQYDEADLPPEGTVETLGEVR